MATRRWLVNASPLILLGKAGQPRLLGALAGQIIVPKAVVEEIGANAQSHCADRVVIDDLEARRCAKVMGLKVIGTLGIVGRAKAMGLLDHAEPVVRRLREIGLYASDELVRRLLREVGE